MASDQDVNFQDVYDYIKKYRRELREISVELRRSGYEEQFSSRPRKNWDQYSAEETVSSRFYQGEFVYFNPDEVSRTEKNVDYYAVNHVLQMLKKYGYKQSVIATICNVSPGTVSHWVTGKEDSGRETGEAVRVKDAIRDNFEYHPKIHPNKYEWWALAIEIRLPASLLDPFLMMVGGVFEPFRVEDQIIYSKMRPDPKTWYNTEIHSARNIHDALKEANLDAKLCREARLAFHLEKRVATGKTKSKKETTGD